MSETKKTQKTQVEVKTPDGRIHDTKRDTAIIDLKIYKY